MSENQTTPEVVWAQRSSSSEPEKNYITLTIGAPDVAKPSIDLKSNSLTFTGLSETKKTTYHVELEFYGEIDVDNSKTHASPANVSFVLRKKELKEEYWPRLLKESKRIHYLKTDFDKWVDEDEQDGAPDDLDAMGGGGMPDMGGMGGGDGGFGGIDFSKLGAGGGGAGGMPDMSALGGMGGMGGMGGEGDDDEDADDDEDMPELEEDDKAADAKDDDGAAGDKAEEAAAPEEKGKAKIEEVS